MQATLLPKGQVQAAKVDLIMGEKYPSEARGESKLQRVINTTESFLSGRQDIEPAAAQRRRQPEVDAFIQPEMKCRHYSSASWARMISSNSNRWTA